MTAKRARRAPTVDDWNAFLVRWGKSRQAKPQCECCCHHGVTVETIVDRIEKTTGMMIDFLRENRAANIRANIEPVGPAAVRIGKLLDEMRAEYDSIVYPFLRRPKEDVV